MTIFDKALIALGGAATSLSMASVAGDMPKWLSITCIAISGASLALARVRNGGKP